MKKLLVIATLVLGTCLANAETAATLDSACSVDVHAAVKTDKQGHNKFVKSDADVVANVFSFGICTGYIRGYMEGMNGTVVLLANGEAWYVQIDAQNIKEWDVAKALHIHLQSVPLDGGKAADVVLFTVLRENGLVKGQKYTQHAPITNEQ